MTSDRITRNQVICSTRPGTRRFILHRHRVRCLLSYNSSSGFEQFDKTNQWIRHCALTCSLDVTTPAFFKSFLCELILHAADWYCRLVPSEGHLPGTQHRMKCITFTFQYPSSNPNWWPNVFIIIIIIVVDNNLNALSEIYTSALYTIFFNSHFHHNWNFEFKIHIARFG